MENKNILTAKDIAAACWKEHGVGQYILEVSKERLDLHSDFVKVIEEIEARKARYLMRGLYPQNADEWEELRDYWASIGYVCSDAEWESYKRGAIGPTEYDEDDVMNGHICEIWPPQDDNEYYSGNLNYDPTSKKRIKKQNKKGYGTIRSQKFINGIEVDDEEFEMYNRREKTRRGGKKHNKKRVTRYEYNDYEEFHQRPLDEAKESRFYDEEKRIIFYRNINNTADTYEWTSLHEFSEWLDENGIEVREQDISILLYTQNSHCCLNPDVSHKELVVDNSYGGLIWTVTDGDDSRLIDVNEAIMKKSSYV